ncbi:MAG: enoyl-CoA hydratase/isomerase family protein [Afipia felis]|jgi:enoyl-CoA hydratase/carnithine racemase|nr:enoyl-CoA hydratase/isomerase family protein [Afipia felis]
MSLTLLERPHEHVALLKLNRPEARNALNDPLRAELASQFEKLAADRNTRCIVITGNERVFAAGADLKEAVESSPIDMMARRVLYFWKVVAGCRKPLIAAVNGFALGGGCELALQADIIVAGEGAKFGQSEVSVGIMPGGGATQRLTRAIGKYRAMKMLLTGEHVTAEEARRLGFVNDVVPDDKVVETAIGIAKTIASMPPLAVEQIKEVVLAGMDSSLDAGLMLERKAFEMLFASRDQEEGMRAFIEKRKPNFEGR